MGRPRFFEGVGEGEGRREASRGGLREGAGERSIWTAGTLEKLHGAFYAFPSIKPSGLSSEEFSERLLFEHQVAVIPGSAFGPSGEGHVRATLATSYEQLEEALVRIDRFVQSLRAS